jgi:hypothetical protein
MGILLVSADGAPPQWARAVIAPLAQFPNCGGTADAFISENEILRLVAVCGVRCADRKTATAPTTPKN